MEWSIGMQTMTEGGESLSLNEAQRVAVTAPDGPALVLAGAGSGKTRVIVERIVWLVEERGVDPRHILAVTFTNRAAGEMKTRVASRIGGDRAACWVGTFHSFGLYLLRREMEKLGRPRMFTVFDDADQLSLMKRLIKGLPAHYAKVTPREALQWISRLKQDVEEPDMAETCATDEDETCRALWVQYHEALLRASAVDFDDLLVLPVRLLEGDAETCARYRRRFRYILVDEYQDTNRAQYRLAKCLSGEGGNLYAVGDEDQSIYSWRGADIRNILEFDRDFPGARIYRLEQNYRSTMPILHTANAVVVHNRNRLGKTLWTLRKSGEPVRLHVAEDGEKEAFFVAKDIAAHKENGDATAVLYRTNGQQRVLEDELRAKGIRYVVVGGIQFYERKEVKDLLAYLRLIANPADDEAFRRAINTPPRGLGATTLEHLETYAKQRGVPLLSVLREIEHDQTLRSRARTAAVEFVHMLDDLAQQAAAGPILPLVEKIIETIDYRSFVEHSDEKDQRDRIEIVDEFLASCKAFDDRGGGGLVEFLQQTALASDTDGYDPSAPAVALMTCHAAKGLEFDSVYLVGLEEGLLPHALSAYSEQGIEEERRLCYVAMTRARKRLTLTAARYRVVYGESGLRELSRFVREIPADVLHVVGEEELRRMAPALPAGRAEPAVRGGLKMGTIVRHAKFGIGRVEYTAGTGKNLKVRVRFQSGRVSTLMASQAPLEILEEKRR